MQIFSLAEWNDISVDQKGVWTTEREDLPNWESLRAAHMGKRTVTRGENGATVLLIEDSSFRIEPKPSAFVIVHPEMGIYLGNCLGLGFWSKLEPGGQSAAVTFPTPDAAKEHVSTWDGGLTMCDLSLFEVLPDDGEYASTAACVQAGLPGWRLSSEPEIVDLACIRREFLACLCQHDWTAREGSAIAVKLFNTAAGMREAHAYVWSGEFNWMLNGDYQSEGRNVLEPRGVLVPKTADAAERQRLMVKFATDADAQVADTYAMRLMR